MNDFVDSFAYWLVDYYLATTVLLAAALTALTVMKQPATRLAVVKAVLVATIMLTALCAIPGWSLIHLAISGPESRPLPVDAPLVNSTPTPVVQPELPNFPASTPADVGPLATVAAAPDRPLTWLSIALAAYALGSAATLLRLTLGMVFARRLLGESSPAPVEVEAVLSSVLADEKSRPRLRLSRQIDVAAALGIVRPTVLLPTSWATGRLATELRTVLAHECAHVQNGDLKWLAISRLASVSLWIHPLYWLVRHRMRLDQESLADAAAADLSSRVTYAEQLVAWARAVPSRPRPALASAVGLWESPSQLRRRVALLLDEHYPVLRECSRRLRWASLLVCGFAALGLSMVTFQPTRSQAQDAISAESADRDADELKLPVDAAAAEESGGMSYDRLGLPVAEDELVGVILDEAGKPLADATVDVWTWHAGNEVQTDKEGRFRLKGFEPHQLVEVKFSKPGFCPKHRATLEVGRVNWIVKLDARTYLEGRVTAPDGEPVLGAKLQATRGPFENPEVQINEVKDEAITDANGKYRLYLEPDTYDIQMRVPGKGMARHSSVQLRDGDHSPLDIELREGPKFRAVVRDSVTNEPVAGIRLWNWQRRGIEGVSNAEGVLEVGNMPPGKFEFQVASAAKPRPRELAGVYARWWSPEALNKWQQLDLTSESDGFQRNFDHLEFDIRDGMEPVTIHLERAVTIRGQVVDPDGKPVAGATVAPAKTGSGNSLTGDTRYSVPTDPDGKFEMRLPASGAVKYNLVAHDGKYEQWRHWANGVSELLETKPGDELSDITLRLSRPCVVRGRVLDAAGQPLANHPVRAHAADKKENRYYDPTTKTNDQGEFTLEFVRPGKHYIQTDPFWLTAEDGPPRGWKLVDASPDRTVDGIELRVGEENQATGTLNVTLQELREKADQVRAASDDAKKGESATKAQTPDATVTIASGSLSFVDTKRKPATPWDYKPNVLAFAVQDESGAPVEGVEAIVYRVSLDTGDRSEVGRAATDARGEVEFAELVEPKWAEALREMVAKSQLLPELRTIFYTVLRRDGLATVLLPASDYSVATTGIKRTVRMRPATELSGRVTDRNGKPVAGALVAAGNLAGSVAIEGANAVRTDSEGRYRLSNVVAFNRAAGDQRKSERDTFILAAQFDMSKRYPAIYDPAEDTSVSDLKVSHPDFAVTTDRGGDVPGSTDIVMQPNSMIVGRVVEFGTSKPVVGGRIKTVGKILEKSGNESLHIVSTQSDKEGEYRLNNLPAGNYEVWAEEAGDVANKQGHISRGLVDVAASAEKSPVRVPDMVLGPGATIRGRLIDDTTGKPLEPGNREMTVKVVTQLIDPFGNQGSPVRQATVDRDGRFSVQAIPGKSRVFLIINTSEPGSNPQGDYRSADDEFEVGPLFDLKHGESIDADFKVWSRAKIEEERAKQRSAAGNR